MLRTVEDTEKSGMEVWKLVAALESPHARHVRAQEWGSWFSQVMSKRRRFGEAWPSPLMSPRQLLQARQVHASIEADTSTG